MAKKQISEAKRLSNQLRNLRRQYDTRIKAFQKAVDIAPETQRRQYEVAVETLKKERANINMAKLRELHEFRKVSGEGYQNTLSATADIYMKKKKERISFIPTQRPADIVRTDTLANVQYKYAAKEIMVFTYGKLWEKGMTKEERQQAIVEKVAKAYDIPSSAVTSRQIMEFYQDMIREFTGDESYEISRDPFGTSMVPGKYAKELESGYAAFLEFANYKQYAEQQREAREGRRK